MAGRRTNNRQQIANQLSFQRDRILLSYRTINEHLYIYLASLPRCVSRAVAFVGAGTHRFERLQLINCITLFIPVLPKATGEDSVRTLLYRKYSLNRAYCYTSINSKYSFPFTSLTNFISSSISYM
jgi:hypothetical protein